MRHRYVEPFAIGLVRAPPEIDSTSGAGMGKKGLLYTRLLVYGFGFQINRMLKLIFDNTDELFHYSTFEWMMENGLEDQLLQVRSSLEVV